MLNMDLNMCKNVQNSWINQQLTNHSYTSTEILDLSSFLFWKSCVKFDIHLDTQLLGYVSSLVKSDSLAIFTHKQQYTEYTAHYVSLTSLNVQGMFVWSCHSPPQSPLIEVDWMAADKWKLLVDF